MILSALDMKGRGEMGKSLKIGSLAAKILLLVVLSAFGQPFLLANETQNSNTFGNARIPKIQKEKYNTRIFEQNNSTETSKIEFGLALKPEMKKDLKHHFQDLGVDLVNVTISWQALEPSQDKYNWRVLDNFLDQLDSNVKAMLRIGTKSRWATKDPKYPSPPRNINDFEEFMNKLMIHIKNHVNGNKIKYFQNDWEINNKPRYWNGTKEEYVENLKTFYRIVKEKKPNSVVVVAGHDGNFRRGNPDNQELFDYIFRHAGNFFDVFDVHSWSNKYHLPHRVEWFRKRMKFFGLNKPIFIAAFGGPMPGEFEVQRKRRYKEQLSQSGRKPLAEQIRKDYEDGVLPEQYKMFFDIIKGTDYKISNHLKQKVERIHSRDIVQRNTLALGSGVKKFWVWTICDRRSPTFGINPLFGRMGLLWGTIDQPGDRKPSFYCYQRYIKKMKGVKDVKMLKATGKDIFVYQVDKVDGNRMYIIWERRDLFYGEDKPPTPLDLSIGFEKAKITDIFGKEEIKVTPGGILHQNVSDTPIYVEALVPRGKEK
jgi:hypothetical protein